MESEVRFTLFKTKGGWVAAAYSPVGLRALILPKKTLKEAKRALAAILGNNLTLGGGPKQTQLAEDLDKYFAGQKVKFIYPLDLSWGTHFQQQVWKTLRSIPYGQVKTYKEIAEYIKLDHAARAIGQAVARNPLPIVVPCHRVVASNGSLGGYSSGLNWKRRLLSLEGVDLDRFKKNSVKKT
jgi:methylated-DNA-[protein]-cysteine S-methyltransferase